MAPDIGRFTSVDPLAEKYYSWSPYVYVMNNPLKYIDPDGKQVRIPINPAQARANVYNQIGQRAQVSSNPVNPMKVVSTTATVLDRTSSGVANNAGHMQIGSNSKLYLPNESGRVFNGNQYVTTKSVSNIGKGVSKVATPVAVITGGLEIADGVAKDGGEFGDNAQKATASVGGGVVGGAVGAKGGAMIGASIGVLGGPGGAGLGAVVGGIVGGISGSVAGSVAGEAIYEEIKKKPEEENK